ncbi:MAG TPA: phosphotransferase, partial [Rubellimicrobium sp.]|nr:phosphotransferase [Rubellimicrobium sp.]
MSEPLAKVGATSGRVSERLLDSPPPAVTPREAQDLARRLFGISGTVSPLASERDTNFRLLAQDGRSFVLKFANSAEPPAITNFQTEALLALERGDPDLPVPKVVRATDGRCEITLAVGRGPEVVLRLLTWVEGEPVATVGVSGGLRRDMGRTLARLGVALARFDHPAASHDLLWDIRNASRLRPMTPSIPDGEMRARVLAELDRFEAEVLPRLPGLRHQVVHNDFNHHNVVVRRSDPDRVSGVIDFGDMVRTALAADVAVAASYLATAADDPVADVAEFLAAYHGVSPLRTEEVELMRDLIVARLVTSIAIT